MVVDLAGFVGNCAVGAHIGALAAAVAAQLVSLGGAGIGLQLILGKQANDLNCRSAGLCHGFGNVLGALAYAGQEHACCGRFHRAQLGVGLGEEVVGIDGSGEHSGDFARIGVGLDGGGQHYHIRLLENLLIFQQVHAVNQQAAVGLGSNLAHLALHIINAVVLHRATVEFIKVLAGGTDIDVKHGHIGIRIFIPDEHSVLCGVHTADFGAVGLASVVRAATAHTLNEHNLLGCLAVTQPLQMALGGAGGVHNPLQLQGGNHILAFVVSIFAVFIQLDCIKAGGYHNGAVLLGDDLILLRVVNGTGLAELLADTAFAGFQLHTGVGINHRHIGNSLGKGGVNGAAGVEAPVELVQGLLGGAFLLADTAAGTLIHIHIAGLLADIHSEIAHKAGNLFHLGPGMYGDILVSRSLHHLRGQNTGRAVQGGEGLIQLAHTATNGRLLFHDIHLIAGIGNIQSGLNTGDAAADDQRPLGNGAFTGEQGGVQMHLGNSSPHQNYGLFCGLGHILVNPRAMLTNVGDFHQVRIEAVPFRAFAEGSLVHTGGAGADHDAFQVLFPDGLGDTKLACLTAHIGIIFRVDNALLQQSHFHDFLYIHRCGNIAAAMANKYTNSTHFLPPILAERAHQKLLGRFLVHQSRNFVGRKALLDTLPDKQLPGGIDQLSRLHIPGTTLDTGKTAQALPGGLGFCQCLHIIVYHISNKLMGLDVHLVKRGTGCGAFAALHTF